MFRPILAASAFSFLALPLAATAHEKILTFDPEQGQTNDQLVADRRACEEKLVEDDIEEPHPLSEDDPLDRRPERSGTGVGASVGGVGVGVGVGGKSPPRSERRSALEDAEHLRRHNAWEIAMIACMEEKGYRE